MLASVLRSEPSPLTLLLPACPPELERIVTKCLQKDADERYQVMKDLALDLKALTRTLDRDSHSEQVSEVGAPMPSKRSLASFTSLATTKRLSPLHVIAILIAAIVVGGAAWWAFVRPEASAEAPPPALLKANEIISWSSIPGETDVFGSLSPPDGRMTVFESTRGGKLSIWVKQTSSGEPVEVTKDTFDNYNPVWSPKGDEIAYLSRRGSELGIWRIPALGGNPILIRKVDDGGSLLKRWLMNGSIYLESNSTLWSVDSNSGGIAQVVSTSPSMTWGSMNISQDGRQSSYVTEENGVSTLWAASATAAGRQVLSTASDMRNTVWDPDGQRILYSANIDGVYQLFAADVSGTKPTQLTFGETNCFPIDVSEDGTRILYGASKEDVQLWSVTTTDLREAPVVTDALADLWPDISPDGAELVYQAIPNISQADKIFDGAILLKSQAGESSNRRLADSGFLPVWSPDQSRVAFLRRGRGDDAALWLVAPSGGPPNRLTGEAIPLPELTVIPYNRYQSASFSWSPDSGTLAYITENANVRNINLVTAKDGSARQLTNNSSAESLPYSPLWSANGRSIAYSISPNSIPEGAEPRYALAVIDTSTGEDRVVAEMNHYVKLLGWANNDRELLFAAANKRRGVATPTQVLLGAVSVATGQTRQIAVLADAYLYDVHPSKDGRTIAFTAHRNGKDDVFIVPAAGGSERRLTDNKDPRVYLSNILWSPDGRTIYFGKQLTRFLLSLISNFK
ncbi:MAG: PD40 domain-containing protein [Acidobacteria bacterium]|nr:PD40 domain-containing protein [Acidobacteriota bacterium]